MLRAYKYGDQTGGSSLYIMTTDRYTDALDFVKTLVLVNHQQRLGILRNITKKQCAVIRQVAYNILFNSSIALTDKDRAYLRRHSKSVKELASRRICLKRKTAILVKKHLLVKYIAEITFHYLR